MIIFEVSREFMVHSRIYYILLDGRNIISQLFLRNESDRIDYSTCDFRKIESHAPGMISLSLSLSTSFRINIHERNHESDRPAVKEKN